MILRIKRRFISTTFKVDSQFAKVFLEPTEEFKPGRWLWNVGFAVSKSKRAMSDWYWKRQNKRRRSLEKQITGTSGMKTIARGFDRVLHMRWHIPPWDALVIDCTSGKPERQFYTFSRWHKHHADWCIDFENQKFFWYRPPYPDDVVWKMFNIKPVTPENPRQNCVGENYFDCFLVQPKGVGKSISNEETLALLGQLL